MNLPPLATHAACLLLGTLLLKPGTSSSSSLPDSAILLPWKAEGSQSLLDPKKRYRLVPRGADCALGKTAFKIWQSATQQNFLLIPRSREGLDSLRALQGRRDILLKDEPALKACRREGAVVYD